MAILKYILDFITNRLVIIGIGLILMFSILTARLFELQIINGQKLEEEFDLSVLRDIDVEGQRGIIYDRNGTALAVNEISYTVNYDNSVYTEDRNALLLKLIRILNNNGDSLSIDFPVVLDEDNNFQFLGSTSSITRFKKDIFSDAEITEEELNYSAEQVIDYLRREEFLDITDSEIEEKSMTLDEFLQLISIRYALWLKGYYKFIPQEVATGISEESLAEIKENKDIFPGVTIVEDPVRTYLYPNLMSHILGYTGTISTEALEEFEEYGYNQNDTVGRIGIEEYMEVYLHAQDGSQTVEVDNLGRTMTVIDETEPVAGKDVYLTIDLDLQEISQDILVKQLCNITSQNLVMVKPTTGDTRKPTLKEVYISLFTNKTVDIEEIMSASEETPYMSSLREDYEAYYTSRTISLNESLKSSLVATNEENESFYTYFLETLISDGYLKADHEESTGYLDFERDIISFNGLLNFYIKEEYLSLERLYEKNNLSYSDKSDGEIFNYLVSQLIEGDYFNRFLFQRAMFTEMLENEEFRYLDLSMLLIEQGIIDIDEETQNQLTNGRLTPLAFMKQVILDVKLTPQQIAVDPSTGAVVIVDVDTGDVLSLVSYPSYDNNLVSDYGYYQELLNDPTNPLYPTATQGKTAPGSTFKMLSAVAGLEEGVITENSLITCTGHFTKITPSIACWIAAYGGSHGTIDVKTGIAVSCNSFFNEVGYRLGIDDEGNYDPTLGVERLNKYVSMFGLDTTTGIELIESKPSTPGGDMDGIINPVTAAMGQEYNSYTPTQIARYISTLANGGTLYELTLIDKIYNSDGSLYDEPEPVVQQVNKFSEGTIETVHEGMIEVTTGSRGTARAYYSDFPILVGGKTGTAQENLSRASHAVFASFAPADDPEIAIVVLIPNSYTAPFSSGYIVGTVAKDLYSAYYELELSRETGSYDDGVFKE